MEDERLLLPIMNALLAFECVGRVKSFSEAARLMGTSQPSASRFVANLEDYLGRPLFHRRNNRIALTEEGERLHRAASVSFEHLRQAVLDLKTSERAQAITIGCTHGFAHLWIMPRFSALQALSPHQEIRVVTTEANAVLGDEDLDLSIRFDDGRAGAEPGAHLFDEEVVLVAAPAFRADCAALLKANQPALLTEAPLLHLDDGEERWLSWREWFARQAIAYRPPPGTYFFRNYAFTLQAAAEGRGIALAWRGLLGPYLGNGWLELLDYPVVRTAGSYRLVCRDALARRAEGRDIIQWFKQEMARGDSAGPALPSAGRGVGAKPGS